MAGMEIFNTDDLTDDFLEINDSLLVPGAPIDEPKNGGDNEPPIDDDDDDKIKDTKKDGDDGVDDFQDLLIPPSDGSDSNKDKDTDDDSSTQNPKFFSSLVQALKEGGVLEDITEDDIKSQDDFFKVIDESIKKREFEDLTDTQKEYLEALREGVPHERIAQHQQMQENFSSISEDALEDESEQGAALRRNVIMSNFMSKGISETKAKRLTDKIFDDGEDVTEAKESIVDLKKAEQDAFEAEKVARQKANAERAKQEEKARNDFNKLVKETDEIIPGQKIPVNIKNKIVKGLTQPVAFTEDNRPMDLISKYLYDNPIDGRFKLAYLLTVTDNFKNMGALESKQTKKNIMKGLEDALKFREDGGSMDTGDNGQGPKFDLDNWEFQ